MFPPPTTMATWTPRSTTALIADATAFTRCGSAPYSRSPSNDSPESFRRIRVNAGSPAVIGRSAAVLLAHGEAGEAADHDVLAGLGGEVSADLLDRLALVLVRVDVDLTQQDDLVEPLVDPALGDLRR